MADLAQRGFGVGILSESMRDGFGADRRGVVIRDIATPALLALVWKKATSPAVHALVERCRAAFGS